MERGRLFKVWRTLNSGVALTDGEKGVALIVSETAALNLTPLHTPVIVSLYICIFCACLGRQRVSFLEKKESGAQEKLQRYFRTVPTWVLEASNTRLMGKSAWGCSSSAKVAKAALAASKAWYMDRDQSRDLPGLCSMLVRGSKYPANHSETDSRS